jgi:hypothetical protein
MWWIYLISIYENRRMKPAKIVPRRGIGVRRKNYKGVNLTKIYCKHICKYHNISTYNYCMLIIIKNKG